MRFINCLLSILIFLLFSKCIDNQNNKKPNITSKVVSEIITNKDSLLVKGMVLIPSGIFEMGSVNEEGFYDEYPKHVVKINSFWMDKTEVTNAQFKKFVDETGYITTAEKKIDWDEIKKGLPENTPKPHDSLLEPSSLVFRYTESSVNLQDHTQWWKFQKGANWKILGDLVVQLMVKKTILLFISVGMMLKPIVNGLVKDSQLRQNGNMHPEAELTILSILGVIK